MMGNLESSSAPYMEYGWPGERLAYRFWKGISYSGVFLLLVVCVLCATPFLYEEGVIPAPLKILLIIGISIGFVAVITFTLLTVTQNDKSARLLQKRIEETYGLELTEQEFASLKYPSKKPGKEPKTYGCFARTSVNSNGETETVVYLLHSENGSLQLKQVI